MADLGGGERGETNRDIANRFATCTGRDTSTRAGAKLIFVSKNVPGINAGCTGIWQHEIEQAVIPSSPPIS